MEENVICPVIHMSNHLYVLPYFDASPSAGVGVEGIR